MHPRRPGRDADRMTGTPADGPFVWNVSGLLADDVGSHRDHEVRDSILALPDDLALATPVQGTVRLAKTNRGILAHAQLTTSLAMECVRCLRPTVVPLELRIEEEYLPSLDLVTGAPVASDDEPEALRLTDHHELDLEPSVRDAISLAEPIAPLDRPDCPGLCIVCGLPLDEGVHDHPDDDIDPRLEALRAFKVDEA
jgi:uncharacterized protein